MNPALNSQIQRIDQALLALVDERARLVAICARAGGGPNGHAQQDSGHCAVGAPGSAPPTMGSQRQDVLRRYAGVLSAAQVHAVLDAISQVCAPGGQP